MFEKVSGEIIGKRLAIVINEEVLLAPKINEAIPGGVIQISLGGMKRDGFEVCKSIYKFCNCIISGWLKL